MKRILLLICFISVFTQKGNAQIPLSKFYNQWIFGFDYFPDQGWGLNLLDFNDGLVSISHYDLGIDYEIGSEGSLLCDSNGQLALVTNGCHISDRDLHIISGGDTIDGLDWAYENFCSHGLPLPSFQNTIMFPSREGSLLVHKNILRQNGGPISTNIKRINIQETNLGYQVVSNESIIDSILIFGKLKATLHNNSDDIWVLANPFNSNEFVPFLVNNDTTIRGPSQKIGPILEDFTYGRARQIAFSSGNNMMAINSIEGLLVYDFDDLTGTLSNYRCYKYPTLTSDGESRVATGLCFSPSDKYVYVSNAENVFQIDLSSDSEAPVIYDYGFQWTIGPNGWPIGIGNMMTGPDCRIYLAPGTSTNFIHVIHFPDEQGEAAGLENYIPLPMRVNHHLPLIPNIFSSCDNTIAFDINTSVLEPVDFEHPLVLYPNPATDRTTLRVDPSLEGFVEIFDVLGNSVLKIEKSKGERDITIDLNSIDVGGYIIHFISQGKRYTSKLIKTE